MILSASWYNISGDPIFVNIFTAASLVWDETTGCTLISYQGDNDPIKVREKPEKIINAAGSSLGYA